MNEDWKIDLEYFNILFLPEILEELPPDMLPDIAGFRQQIRTMQKGEPHSPKCRVAPCRKIQPIILDKRFEDYDTAAGEECAFREREEEPDARTRAIIDAWESIERKFGITIDDLYVILRSRVKLSRLTITTSNRLYLTDFENKEVKMDDLTKALYYFYLRHPEGATLKELYEHEDEILKYYSGITGRDDYNRIRKSVKDLLDPYGNGRNVSISRIKKAFRNAVGDPVAGFYYVDGKYGGSRKVRIDRDLVIWEH